MNISNIVLITLIGLLFLFFIISKKKQKKETNISLNEQIQKLSLLKCLKNEFIQTLISVKNTSQISNIVEKYIEEKDELIVLLFDDLELDFRNLTYIQSFEKAKLEISLSDFIEHLNKGTIDTSQYHFKLTLKYGF